METSIIEQYDKKRFNLIKWLTLGWALWFGAYIIKDLINSKTIFGIILLLGLPGWLLFVVSLIRYLKIGKAIKSDIRLKNALNNELHRLYIYKSVYIGFWSLIVTIIIFFGISLFYKISALIVCEVTLYIGILASLISALIYNKN